jgi:hypothetical protein
MFMEKQGSVVRVIGYRSGGPGSIPGSTRFSEKKKTVVNGERGPFSLVSTTEQLLDRKVKSCLENREYGRRDPSRWPRGTFYPHKLAITSLTREFVCLSNQLHWQTASAYFVRLRCEYNVAQSCAYRAQCISVCGALTDFAFFNSAILVLVYPAQLDHPNYSMLHCWTQQRSSKRLQMTAAGFYHCTCVLTSYAPQLVIRKEAFLYCCYETVLWIRHQRRLCTRFCRPHRQLFSILQWFYDY